MSNIETARSLYAAFDRGDLSFILDKIAPEASWEHWATGNAAQEAGVPWMAERRGPEGAKEFFGIVEEMEFHAFEVIALMEGGDHVAALIYFDLTFRPTGKRLSGDEIHLWQFNPDGKVISYRHFLDTARSIEASRGDSSAAG